MKYENQTGISDEWYTPKYIFEALGETFDLDVASPRQKTHVPAAEFIFELSLMCNWFGFIWMNPPFGKASNKERWINKFYLHGNGIALTPDRTSAAWWHDSFNQCDAVLFTKGRISFERPDGTKGIGNGTGTCLWASGERAVKALLRAEKNKLGAVFIKPSMSPDT